MQQQDGNVWVPVIDKLFSKLDGVSCIRDNKSSFSSRKRKREAQEKTERKKRGVDPV
ncbi:hypothetical protein BY458DRAFT_563206 [Sporodiniella umbellata]|nr:hypothetical protein BY458DRAFT_563206 [Sporodiniella umbellata]